MSLKRMLILFFFSFFFFLIELDDGCWPQHMLSCGAKNESTFIQFVKVLAKNIEIYRQHFHLQCCIYETQLISQFAKTFSAK